ILHDYTIGTKTRHLQQNKRVQLFGPRNFGLRIEVVCFRAWPPCGVLGGPSNWPLPPHHATACNGTLSVSVNVPQLDSSMRPNHKVISSCCGHPSANASAVSRTRSTISRFAIAEGVDGRHQAPESPFLAAGVGGLA